jgi:hypothetical protein
MCLRLMRRKIINIHLNLKVCNERFNWRQLNCKALRIGIKNNFNFFELGTKSKTQINFYKYLPECGELANRQ